MTPIRELPYAHPVAPTPPPVAPAKTATPAEEPSAFAQLVRGFSREADRGEATVRSVLAPTEGHGTLGPLDAPQLLALQAGIYRYGETMDLAARLVDKASSGVKSIIQAQ